MANRKRICYTLAVDEGRKRVLLIAASILAARRLAEIECTPSPAFKTCIREAIDKADSIMREIDQMWPSHTMSERSRSD